MFVEYQPSTPSRRALIPGAIDRLDPGLTGLEVLPADRQPLLLRERHHRRHVHRQVGGAVREGHILHQRGVRVDHARRNRGIVGLERLFERVDRLVRGRFLHEDFGAAAPDHDEPIEVVVFLERTDVGAKLLGKIPLVLAFLDVRPVQPLHVALIEYRGHGLDGLELGLDLVEQRRLEHAGRPRGLVGVLFEDIPAAEDDVVQIDQRNRLVDFWRSAFGALAETDRAHLRERSDGIGQTFPHGQNTGDGRGADRAETDQKYA